jgi:poly(3-hydroxybutyrate) depolymerase
MAETQNRAQPRSLTLMAGPIDTRISPTKVNELAKSRSIEWFEKKLIGTVPWRYRGAGRKVYPGFLQLTAFMTMNLDRHINAHLAQFRALAGGDMASADAHRRFYEEYGAVMDLPAEFYLETVKRIFQDHDLPLGRLMWHGQKVRPDLIRRTALLTVEGERDDICAIGQTMAALDLCSGIRVNMRSHHLQSGVGHYGVFSGTRWTREVYPKVRQMIQITN